MIIKQLTIQGFRSFAEKQTINFDNLNGFIFVTGENLADPELGSNGSGKSSLIESLVFCLFGKTSTNLKAGEIKNWWSDEKCEVELVTDKGAIKRTWSPNSLKLDGDEITQDGLEKVIGLNFDSFMYSIFISQFGQKFIDFQPEQKMKIFTSILGDYLDRWNLYSKKASEGIDDRIIVLTNLNNEISNIRGQIKSLDTLKLEESKEDWEKRRKEKLRSLREDLKVSDIDDIENDLVGYGNEEKKLESYNVIITSKIESLTEEINDLEDEITELRESTLKIDYTISALNKSIKNLNSLDSVCPTCLQKVSKKHLKDEETKLNKELQENEKDLEDFEEKLNKVKSKLKLHTDMVKSLNKDFNDSQKVKIQYIKLIADTEAALKAEKEACKRITKEVEALKKEINPYEALLKESKTKFILLNRLILHKEDSCLEERKLIDIYKYWVKAFKEIRLFILEEALLELEITINTNIKKMGLINWEVFVDVDKENKTGGVKKGFAITVKSPFNEKSVSFDCWSGGEGQRIRLATTLGLADFIKNRRCVDSNILILDEPTQFLSENGIDDLLQILKDKSVYDNIKLLLIDHRDLDTSGLFDSSIKVTKSLKGGSHVLCGE